AANSRTRTSPRGPFGPERGRLGSQGHTADMRKRSVNETPLVGMSAGAEELCSRAQQAERIWNIGARPAIPPKRTDPPVACPDWIYNNNRLVENLWARLKEWRGGA